MIIVVPLAGEIKFYPFHDTFRVSFATPMFFFFLLLLRKTPPVVPGFLIGLGVLFFRILLDLVIEDPFIFVDSFQTRVPAFFYYLTFSLIFQIIQVNRFHHQPIIIGVMGILIEIVASIAELTVQNINAGNLITLSGFVQVMVIAIFRSFFALALFSIIKLYEAKLREIQIQKKNEHLLMLLSNLYEESIHLKKTLQNAEKITKDTYDLYRSLNQFKEMDGVNIHSFGQKALRIAGEVHEIKKDNQRIFAGLSRLISGENFADYIDIKKLIRIIFRINEKYAYSIDKEITFQYFIEGNYPKFHVYLVLSILNNLVTNAVEAIEEKGFIIITVKECSGFVTFEVKDNGPGIPMKYKEIIFKPGFTSKYDYTGTPSTGIGLSYVKDIVIENKGEIAVENGPSGEGAIFTIKLPIASLMEKG